jgi:hypothetical protein
MFCFSSLAPLLPGGVSRGVGKGAGLPRRYSACLVLMAVSMTIFLLHTVLLSDSRNLSQVPLLGRTIQVRQYISTSACLNFSGRVIINFFSSFIINFFSRIKLSLLRFHK